MLETALKVFVLVFGLFAGAACAVLAFGHFKDNRVDVDWTWAAFAFVCFGFTVLTAFALRRPVRR